MARTDEQAARPPAVALVGMTASGKSALALAVARTLPDVEIVTVDSMQVYRGMDVGTATPTRDEQAEVRHHLIDVADPWEEYSVARFQHDARAVLADIAGRGRRALLVGGTALYLRAVIDDLDVPGRYPDARAEVEAEPDTESLHRRLVVLDPVAASRMEPGNRRRIVRALEVTVGSGRRFSSFGPGLAEHSEATIPQIGVRLPAASVADRIGGRYQQQMADGFLAEVDALLALDRPLSRTAAQALGYRELIGFRRGETDLDGALDLAVRRTRQFAKRQRAWFRRDPRITWLDTQDPRDAIDDLLTMVTRHLDP